MAPPVHAGIIGDTGDLYHAARERRRRLARDLGVPERLHFLGHVNLETLAEAYRAADAFIMPSVWEGFCIPVLEAMASGVPVLAARAGALPETVAGAGLTFRPDDSEDLVRQIRRVLLSAERRSAERLGAAALPRSGAPALLHKRVAI